MAIMALSSAASGLKALSTRIDVIANNLANAETNGFKGSRANFEDLFYVPVQQPGTESASSDAAPMSTYVGLGTKISNTQLDFTQGTLEKTDGPTDVAIEGNGFFRVKVLSALGDGTAYARNGNFYTDKDGDLVLGSGDGYRLVPPIQIDPKATSVSIGQDGKVTITKADGTKGTAGQIQLTNFVNPQGLQQVGSTLYQETPASGPPISGNPGDNGTGTLLQGYLESSNVDPVKELTSLIKTQRAFELNSQSIQSADQALQTIANIKRS